MQVDSGEISCHMVSINPKNHGFLDPTSQLGRYLGHLKFGVNQIEKHQLYDLTGALGRKKMIAP